MYKALVSLGRKLPSKWTGNISTWEPHSWVCVCLCMQAQGRGQKSTFNVFFYFYTLSSETGSVSGPGVNFLGGLVPLSPGHLSLPHQHLGSGHVFYCLDFFFLKNGHWAFILSYCSHSNHCAHPQFMDLAIGHTQSKHNSLPTGIRLGWRWYIDQHREWAEQSVWGKGIRGGGSRLGETQMVSMNLKELERSFLRKSLRSSYKSVMNWHI